MSYAFLKGLGALGEALGELQFSGRGDIRGHKDYPPDQGGKNFHFRDCRLKREGSGAYGSVWDCNRIDHKTVLVRPGDNPPLPEGDDPERNCKRTSITSSGTRYFKCPRWVVDAEVTEGEAAQYADQCLIEGQQGTPEWRLKSASRPDRGSSSDRFFHYTDVVRGDHVLRCKFAEPIPSKERAFQAAAHARLVSAGKRFVTVAEQEQYGSLCQPRVTATGVEVPTRLSWRKKTDYIGTAIQRTEVTDGDYILVCVPDTSKVKMVIDAELTRLQQARANAMTQQRSAAEQQALEEAQAELQRILAAGEEPQAPFWVRYKVPLLMVGGMLVLGAGAALVQRALTKRKKMTANPDVFAETEGDGLWIFYWQQPGTSRADATVIGWSMVSDDPDGGYSLVTESAADRDVGVFHSFDDASKWLVRKTWRVVPGGF